MGGGGQQVRAASVAWNWSSPTSVGRRPASVSRLRGMELTRTDIIWEAASKCEPPPWHGTGVSTFRTGRDSIWEAASKCEPPPWHGTVFFRFCIRNWLSCDDERD